MPAVKTSSLPTARASGSPYGASLHTPRIEKGPWVRIYTPPLDDSFSPELSPPYDSFDDSQFSLSQWMNAGPLFADTEMYGSGKHPLFRSTAHPDLSAVAQCPPSLTPSPLPEDHLSYDGPVDGQLFSWPSPGAGYDASHSAYVDSSASPSTVFGSPSISIVSCSPRSECVSLSPPPPYSDYTNAFSFDFSTTSSLDFPSSSWSPISLTHSPKSCTSHSPTLSCSSLDPSEIKTSPSREVSPSRLEVDPQQLKRRFPCLILGCDRRFTSQYTLKVHMEAHKPKPRVSFPCTLGCSERFSRQHDRLRHEVAKHGKVCEFSCDDCSRFFSTRKTLGNHKCPVTQGGTRWVNN